MLALNISTQLCYYSSPYCFQSNQPINFMFELVYQWLKYSPPELTELKLSSDQCEIPKKYFFMAASHLFFMTLFQWCKKASVNYPPDVTTPKEILTIQLHSIWEHRPKTQIYLESVSCMLGGNDVVFDKCIQTIFSKWDNEISLNALKIEISSYMDFRIFGMALIIEWFLGLLQTCQKFD